LDSRDNQIINAFNELALEGKKAVRWTQVKKKTGFSAGKFDRGLKSLEHYGQVISEHISPKIKIYALPKFKNELIKKVSAIRSRDISQLEKLMNDVLTQLRNEGFIEITLDMLANKVAKPPNVITHLAHQLAPKYGLKLGGEIRKKGLWNNVRFQLEFAGGTVKKFYIQQMILGDEDPKIGWYKKIYQDKEEATGILILKGATELSSIASQFGIHHLRKYHGNFLKYGILLTTTRLDQEDKLWVNGSLFLVKEVERKFDDTELAFYIVHACEVPR
jgi:hypothetical protein